MALLVAVTGWSGAGPVAAASANPTCTGTLAAGNYANVTVPAGQTCILGTGVTVTGTVTVQPNATLDLFGATIGNLVAQQGTYIQFNCGTVTGNFTDTNGASVDQEGGCVSYSPSTVQGSESITGVTGQVVINQGIIGGNLSVSGNHTSSVVDLLSAQVGSNLTVTNNTAGGGLVLSGDTVGNNLTVTNNTASGGLYVNNSTVTNNLVCTGNTPPPTAHSNTARQNVGQCAGSPA